MATTPERPFYNVQPTMGKSQMTEAYKQMIVNNLQLEITARARALRAQYNLQAQQLRSRLELRVTRIPYALRNVKIQDLINKHSGVAITEMQVSEPVITYPRLTALASDIRGTKRTSDVMAASDKENDNMVDNLNNPKKRIKTNTNTVTSTQTRPLSTVLSPKSSNSRLPTVMARTGPISPLKSTSPMKYLSPMKSAASLLTSKPSVPRLVAAFNTSSPKKASTVRPVSRQTSKKPTITTTKPFSRPASPDEQISRPGTAASGSISATTITTTTDTVNDASNSVKSNTINRSKATTSTTTSKSKAANAAKGIKSALSSLTGSKRAKTAVANTEGEVGHAPGEKNSTVVGGRILRKRN